MKILKFKTGCIFAVRKPVGESSCVLRIVFGIFLGALPEIILGKDQQTEIHIPHQIHR